MGATITGVVVPGDQRGRELGFPTANMRFATGTNPPEFGIYAGLVDGRSAAVSVGIRPTFGAGQEPLLEAHILDFDADLYGQTVTVELLQMIRAELAFANVAELVEQMHKDVEQVRSIIGERPREVT